VKKTPQSPATSPVVPNRPPTLGHGPTHLHRPTSNPIQAKWDQHDPASRGTLRSALEMAVARHPAHVGPRLGSPAPCTRGTRCSRTSPRQPNTQYEVSGRRGAAALPSL
jgi:hypothetical protein